MAAGTLNFLLYQQIFIFGGARDLSVLLVFKIGQEFEHID